MIRNIKIIFWKTVAKFWDLRPRMHLPQHSDYPIASTFISDKYEYPEGIRVLYEWDEKGMHWIAFTRK